VLLHDLLLQGARRFPNDPALLFKQESISYSTLGSTVSSVASGLLNIGLARGGRVGVYLPKRPETVAGMFGITLAGGVFVPINPLLKDDQVGHILRDCDVQILITSEDRIPQLRGSLAESSALRTVVVVRASDESPLGVEDARIISWESLLDEHPKKEFHRTIDEDLAAIFYTSGSTGKPKGVMLSHRNMVAGAQSVAQYLDNRSADRLLAVLPFSFDYGFSQLSTAFLVGASVALIDYLFPRDVVSAVDKFGITGLAGVPPLWNQLARLEWPDGVKNTLRYITNSGGAMPRTTLDELRASLPSTKFYLMYGLTEAFRSTYLPPEDIDQRPDSIGKAIPNAEVVVLREDGTQCDAGEPGELVHRGVMVSLGYWNDPVKTAERFRVLPPQDPGMVHREIAVWSGDTVMRDADGYLYFVGRRDEMIKTSGYRVSPAEIEEVVYATGLVTEAIAIAASHPALGQGIVLIFVPAADTGDVAATADELLNHCRERLPNYMVPGHIEGRKSIPRNPNGKIDRAMIHREFASVFESAET
jgi:acyl-CoA ligase (AMP-forming) (exosortase A-associated)